MDAVGKCYACENESVLVCKECGKFFCKEHGSKKDMECTECLDVNPFPDEL